MCRQETGSLEVSVCQNVIPAQLQQHYSENSRCINCRGEIEFQSILELLVDLHLIDGKCMGTRQSRAANAEVCE
jgi:hypothetical protein